MLKTNLEQVAEFHDVSGLEYRKSPGFPKNEKIALRLSLLEEEMEELEEAAYKNDLVGVADALADIQYILLGAVLDFGLQEHFDKINEEVHRSNMSKFCSSTDEARESINKYMKKEIEAYYKLVKGRFVIRRASDEKILKGINFDEPKIEKILHKHLTK